MSTTQPGSRRGFLKTSAAVSAGSLLASVVGTPVAAAEQQQQTDSVIHSGDTILFQGDSITDAGRSRADANQPNEKSGMGNGYAWMAAAGLLTDPQLENLKIYNRGIGGNKVFQLADRWQADCLELKPDVLSILIGVNDIWHKLNGNYDGTVDVYERDYRALLKRTKDSLPDVKLVICEPFVLKCGAIDDKWFPLFDGYRAAAKTVATEFDAIWVPFQTLFDEAVKYAEPSHWAKDGVHPSPFGAALMAAQWRRCVIG